MLEVILTCDDGGEAVSCSLESFLAENKLDEEEERALMAGDRVALGGADGAPPIHVELAPIGLQTHELRIGTGAYVVQTWPAPQGGYAYMSGDVAGRTTGTRADAITDVTAALKARAGEGGR